MKILKKAMSAFLAALMCIPSGILSIANAAETNPNGDYTVMLTDAENGLLQFSEECMNASTASQEGYNMMQVGEDGSMNQIENDGSIWAFKEGDTVEIETIPGDRYHVESFAVKDSSSGDIVAEKETSDNVFSFTMPGKNVSVEAVFTDKKIPETTESVETTENIETKKDNIDKNNGDDEIPAESNLWVRPMEDASILVMNGSEGLIITGEDGKAFAEDMVTKEVTEVTDVLEDGYYPADILPDADGNVSVIIRAGQYHSVQDVSVHYENGEDTGDDTLENSPLGLAASYDLIIPENGEAKYVDAEMVKNRDDDSGFLQTDNNFVAAYSTRGAAMARAAAGGTNTNVPSSMTCNKGSNFGGTNRYELDSAFNSFCFDPMKKSPANPPQTMTTYLVKPDDSYEKFRIPGEDIPLLKAAFATCTPIGPKGKNDGLGTLGGKVPGTTEYDMWRDCVNATTGGDVAAVSVEILHVIFSEVAGNLSSDLTVSASNGTGWVALTQSPHMEQIMAFKKKLRDYANENSEALEAYNLYVAIPSDGSKQRLIFIEKMPRDPLGLYIFKKGAEGKEAFNGSQLAGAQFEVLYYPNKRGSNGNVIPQKYSSAEEAQRLGHDAVQFIFETRSVNLGTQPFIAQAGNEYDYGIDFRPLDEDADPWVNNFIISGQAKYQTVFGQSGTYVIREYTPPKGYTLTGEMSASTQDGSVVKTSNLRTGLALYVERNGRVATYEINGHPAGSGNVNVGIEVEDNPIPLNVSTVALSMDTGQQYADPKSTNVRLRDSIKIDIPEDKEALYTVKTWVEIAKGKTENEKGNRVAVKWEGDRTATTREKETVFSTASAGVSPGSSYEFFLECSVDAVQQDLAGKTVVFMNQVIVKDGRNGDGPDNNKDGYIWNKTYGEGDTAEMIHFSESNTDIISNQTERKNGLGASIIYAGMYTDGSYTSGGGSIKQELTDTIHYKNLQKNRTYYVVGELIDAETGQPAVDANGTPIKNTVNTQQQHSSSSGTGEWKIVYSFDATGCGGRKYVSFVKVYLGDEMVAHYDKIGDLKESFYIPEITTKLKDSKTGLDVSYAEEQVTFTDTITYRKFLPNVNYKVVTKLINMETKEILKDVNGQDVVSETQFRPTTEDGTKDINITFPAMVKDSDGNIVRSLAGTVIVAYEYIYIERGQEGSGNWVLVADHTDFWDKNQRMYMPLITTTAWDQKTEHHISMAEKYMTIYDKVHYEGIRPEYNYILRSQLVDISTGEVVRDDANVLQEKTTGFKADGDLLANHYLFYGDVIPDEKEKKGVWFTLDAESFAGRTLVVFEELLIETPNGVYTLATHKDLLDEMQTIHIPKVSTSAADGRTGAKTVYADGDRVTVVDTFSYDNLIPGLTYRLEGRVVDKNQTVSTGSEVALTGTDGKPAKNSDTFTAESSSGSRRLSFDIDLSKYSGDAFQGVELVVFEELYVVDRYDGADHECLVAGHTDISDKNQTVYVPKVTTSLRDRKTGTQVLNPSKDACLVDTISYFRMQPDTEYTVRGKLIDMQTGKVLAGSDGEKAEKEEKRRTDEDGTGKWEIEYKFDASELGGKIIVAYEEVYINSGKHAGENVMIASHRSFCRII